MSVEQETINKTHPEFKITCLKCNSERVILENTLGFSDTSGQWGSIDFVCIDCKNRTGIYGDVY